MPRVSSGLLGYSLNLQSVELLMLTILAFLTKLIAAGKAAFAVAPWLRFVVLCLVVFVGGCRFGRNMEREARAKEKPVEVRPERRPILPRLREEAAKPETPKLPEAADHFVEPNKTIEPTPAPATASQPQSPRPVAACAGGQCYAPSRRVFGRWR